MYHFFVEPWQVSEKTVRIQGADVNHVKNVLRMKPGEQVLVSSLEGMDYLCRVSTLSSEEVLLELLERREDTMELPSRIHLFQGFPKSDKMELIIQKAVELGVYRIIPVNTRRVVVKLDAKKEEARIKRFNAISESAAKQSKRSLIPEVTGVISFTQALERVKAFDLKLLPYECADGIAKTRERIEGARPGTDIAVFIGPEGGFEEEEVRLALQAGVEPITLGKRILRTETAGLCILSALMLKLEQ